MRASLPLNAHRSLLALVLIPCLFLAGCDDDDEVSGRSLDEVLLSMDVARHETIVPIGQRQNGEWTEYLFDPAECQCRYPEQEFFVAVSPGDPEKVLLYYEGGGAEWPGGGSLFPIVLPANYGGFKRRSPENPMHDWTMVFVAYCNASIFSGDSAVEHEGETQRYWGMRHSSAAANLVRDLYPQAETIVVSGSSAGAFGTFLGYGIMRHRFPEAEMHLLNDSGPGFWNPDDAETWAFIRDAWALDQFFPEECGSCDGTTFLEIYDIYMGLDPNLRVGMISSKRDRVITEVFLEMDPLVFTDVLLTETERLKAAYPERFNRFIMDTNSHTVNEVYLPEGIDVEANGTPLHVWLTGFIANDSRWQDIIE